jgi:hypothetical protein
MWRPTGGPSSKVESGWLFEPVQGSLGSSVFTQCPEVDYDETFSPVV